MTITLYLVGYDEDDAKTSLLFDSEDSADDYCQDNPGMKLFTVNAWVDFNTIEPVS
jgi:hypothetical protein